MSSRQPSGTLKQPESTKHDSARKPFHDFDGRPKGRREKSSRFSQASLRRIITLWDQHGRQWWATVENRTGMPVGQIEPKDFKAPWLPDQKYLVVDEENASRLWVNYRAMAVGRKAAENEYHARATQLAAEKKWPQPERNEYPTEIINALGRPPRSVKLVLAAWQENPWMLGETELADPRLEALVEAERPVVPVTPEDLGGEDFGPDSFRALFAKELAELEAEAAAAATTDGVDTSPPTQPELDAFEGDGDADATDADAQLEQLLAGVEEEHDADALGGKTVAPKNAARVARQAPRPATQSAKRTKHGTHRSQKERRRRPSLADGAAPVVAGD